LEKRSPVIIHGTIYLDYTSICRLYYGELVPVTSSCQP
jgi:hypothetical protein